MTEPALPGVHLRVYHAFTDITSRVQSDAPQLRLTFSTRAWTDIQPHSLTLRGLPYTARTDTPGVSWLTSLEGRTIHVRQLARDPEEVTLVRAADLLVRDRRGAHFHAEPRDLLFPDVPPTRSADGAVVVQYDLSGPGEGHLSYATSAVRWSAHYQLDLQEDRVAHLSGYATLHNDSDQPLHPDALTLIAGDIRYGQSRPSRPRYHGVALAAAESSLLAASPTWSASVEAEQPDGLYSFELNHPPVLPALSQVSVPFEDGHTVTWTALSRIDLYGPGGTQAGHAVREGTLEVDRPLLPANVTIRDRQVIVGEQRVPETAAGDRVTFTLGRDPHLRYHRRQEVVNTADPDLPTSQGRTTHVVRYTLTNAGPRPISYRLQEVLERAEEVVRVTGDGTFDGQHLLHEGTVGAGEVQVVNFKVYVKPRQQRR